jgi:hypothetical protein
MPGASGGRDSRAFPVTSDPPAAVHYELYKSTEILPESTLNSEIHLGDPGWRGENLRTKPGHEARGQLGPEGLTSGSSSPSPVGQNKTTEPSVSTSIPVGPSSTALGGLSLQQTEPQQVLFTLSDVPCVGSVALPAPAYGSLEATRPFSAAEQRTVDGAIALAIQLFPEVASDALLRERMTSVTGEAFRVADES